MYGNCHITWFSCLQKIALSTTEAEYIALSTATREVLPMITFISEIAPVMGIPIAKPDIKCTIFEENKGAEELTKFHKSRARTKHITVKYHHFRQAVKDKILYITRIETKVQRADIFTKTFSCPSFETLRHSIMGWMLMLTKQQIQHDHNPSMACNLAMK
eukprot:3109481-Ditylum_brightwellii.AAC.1